MKTRPTTDPFRIQAAKIICEIGCALQHMEQADEDSDSDAGMNLELAEAVDCLENAGDKLSDLVCHLQTTIAYGSPSVPSVPSVP